MVQEEFNKENWLPVKGWECYLISETGKVYSVRRKRLLKHYLDVKGYPKTTLSIAGKEQGIFIHRLIAEAFIPNPENKRTVNHINGIKNDFTLHNLEWATYSENGLHAYANGLSKSHPVYGEDHPACKINNIDLAMINVLVKHDFTDEQIAKRFGVHETHIGRIKRGTRRALTGQELEIKDK